MADFDLVFLNVFPDDVRPVDCLSKSTNHNRDTMDGVLQGIK